MCYILLVFLSFLAFYFEKQKMLEIIFLVKYKGKIYNVYWQLNYFEKSRCTFERCIDF